MWSSLVFIVLSTLAGPGITFPALFKVALNERSAEGCPFAKRALEEGSLKDRSLKDPLKKRIMGVAPGFNAAAQYVSTTGKHAWIAPGPLDARGPCPGLNAMANHGYIPHNGVATIDQFVQGTYQVFGMGTDLATFLAIYGAVMDGDLTSWSIGGPTVSLPSLIGGLLAQPQGISASHNKYESDVSPTRGDLYEYGNDYLIEKPQFQDLYSQPLGPYGYDLTTLTPFRAKRFQQSINNNPYFFNGPFTGVFVQPAAYTFIYRFMANKSAEHPEGYLNGDVLKSFFSITGSSGNFEYTPGWERIPNNWYKRAVGDEYTIPYFGIDMSTAALRYPQFLDVGGNTGKANTFTGIDIQNLTGGVYNAQSLTQGNNLACFGYQMALQVSPDILKGLYSDITTAEAKIANAVTQATAGLGCPQLSSIDQSQFSQYPGYTKLKSNGQY